MNEAGAGAIARYLDSLEHERTYRVESVLKETPNEVTQLVSLASEDEPGMQRFVRKLIRRESRMGHAYERIYAAQQESRVLGHVPAIRECYANDLDLVVVMEHIDGETLRAHVERRGPSMQLAIDVFPLLCDAASELHEAFDPPIVHRDLSPDNVMLSGGRLVLIDFGIARDYHEGARSDTTKLGTRPFAPPEQYGFGQTSVRSDVFALGTVLFYCLTGHVPDMHVDSSDLADWPVPQPLRGVIERATAIDPSNRYGSVRELRQAFMDATGSRQLDARRWTGLGRVWNVLLALVFVVLVSASVDAFLDPTGSNAGYPVWINAIGFCVLNPVFTLSGVWMLVDKRRLRERYPRLQKYRFRHWFMLFVLSFFLMFIVMGVCLTAAGV